MTDREPEDSPIDLPRVCGWIALSFSILFSIAAAAAFYTNR